MSLQGAATHRGTRDKDISAKALSQVGYWSRDEVVAMDRNATLAMARHHPNRASIEIKKLFLEIKKRAREQKIPQSPTFTPADTTLLLTELFLTLPETDGNDDPSPVEIRRVHMETAKVIRKAIALKHKITIGDMDSACRNRNLVMARQEAMYLVARDCPSLSYPRLGRMFGGKDHTSVLHGIRKHADRNGLPLIRGAFHNENP